MSKQVIVMRKDLKMPKGKMIAQGSHAVLGIFLQMMRNNVPHEGYSPDIQNGKYEMTLEVTEGSDLDHWLRGIYKKICLAVNSEEELLDIYNQAKEAGLPALLVEDLGLTMFNGVKTKTCLAIGPADDESIDKITGHLGLL